MLVSFFFVSFLWISAGALLAKPRLQIHTEEPPNPSVSPNLIDAAFASNISTGAPGLSAAVNNAVVCNGALYGFNPNIADCEGAAQSIVPDSDQITWGERHTGLSMDIFPLPFAVFGDRAECAVHTVMRGGGPTTAHASFKQVKNAASALSLLCAAGFPSQGGIATNIGGDNNLAVILSTYEPNIKCGGADTFEDPSACGSTLADMPASKEKLLFGPKNVPGVQEPLPQIIASSGQDCLLRIFSTGRADSTSWYSIWEAAEATFAKCGRDRRPGSFRGLGDHGDVFLTLAPIPTTESLGNLSLVGTA